MSVLPAPPPNWRRDTLRQASEALLKAAADPELAWKDLIQLENLAGALQQMEAEEARVSRDPKQLEVFPGMSVGYEFDGVVREFLVVEIRPTKGGSTWIYGGVTHPNREPCCITLAQVLWARSSDHRLVFQSPDVGKP